LEKMSSYLSHFWERIRIMAKEASVFTIASVSGHRNKSTEICLFSFIK
jgi:hypothetical protein